MRLTTLSMDFSVCQLSSLTGLSLGEAAYTFLSVTDDEISLVCETSRVPQNVLVAEHGWKALKICGPLDFGMVGVIAKIATLLAQCQISVFVVSTYNTDYVLLKAENLAAAARILAENGYEVSV